MTGVRWSPRRSSLARVLHISSAFCRLYSRSCLVAARGGQLFGIGRCELRVAVYENSAIDGRRGGVGVTGLWVIGDDDGTLGNLDGFYLLYSV